MNEAETLSKWRRLHDLQKTLFGWPGWKALPLHHNQSATMSLKSNIAHREDLIGILADRDSGISIEAIRLRLIAVYSRSPEPEITATLEVEDNDWTCIARMDFGNDRHMNKYWRKYGLPSIIDGPHHHAFHLNSKIGLNAFKPHGNLDNAEKFESEQISFRDKLRLIGHYWKIDGIANLDAPPRQENLFFDP